jgi:hypothetical protein
LEWLLVDNYDNDHSWVWRFLSYYTLSKVISKLINFRIVCQVAAITGIFLTSMMFVALENTTNFDLKE